MSQRSLLILTLATLAVGGGAWLTTQKRAPETEIVKAPLYPALNGHVNDVNRIEVKGKKQSVTVSAKEGGWVVESRSNYPAQAEMVKQTVLGVSELKILETKTNNKELYAKLEVEDLDAENAASKLLSLSDKNGKPVASLLVGKHRSAAGPGPSALYVRKQGDAQALLVEGDLNVSADPQDWLEKELFNIDGNRISEISVEQPGQKALRVYRKTDDAKDLTLDNIPPGQKTKSQFTVNSLATALESMRMDDVVAKNGFESPKEQTIARFKTFDGLVATAHVFKVNDKSHVAFEFSFDAATAAKHAKPTPAPSPTPATTPNPSVTPAPTPVPTPTGPTPESVEKEVKAMNDKHSQWIYVLPEFKAGLFTKKMADLAGPEEKQDKTKAGKGGVASPPVNPLEQESSMPLPAELQPHSH